MPNVVRVAIPVPLGQAFDYLLPPEGPTSAAPGTRVLVPFGGRRSVGVVLQDDVTSEVASARLKSVLEVLDETPIFSTELLGTLQWLARYYHHPVGEVLDTALPATLRRARSVPPLGVPALVLTEAAAVTAARAGSTSETLLQLLRDRPRTMDELDRRLPRWRAGAANLRRRGLVRLAHLTPASVRAVRIAGPPLTPEQQHAVTTIARSAGTFAQFVLEGITGSGKTEVYLTLAASVLAAERQVLILVPEIGLTPQLVRRVRERLAAPVHVLHSGLADGERTQAWLAAASGQPAVVLGTRSAVFTPLPRAGLIVVDEEHDASYKQQDGLRYSARDTALVRGKALGVPVVLGSATPSLETLANVEAGRYQRLRLSARPGAARMPSLHTIDLRGKPLRDGLAPELIEAIQRCVSRGEQALLFRNRRGYSPVLLCHACGWHAVCARCDKPLTWHRDAARLQCHHCGAQQRIPAHCPNCASPTLAPQGFGTERLEEGLRKLFPGIPVLRVDRETTRRKGALESLLDQLQPDHPGILVGTQMLAKGHDLPNLTLVALVGVDEGLFSVDFRAGERLAQLITQVSGRAGRAHKPGSVWLQTHHPDHPLLRNLLQHGYAHVAKMLLEERSTACLPPYAYLALLRAEAKHWTIVEEFLERARGLAGPAAPVELLGPLPAPMPKRAGMHRGQLLLSSAQRAPLHEILSRWIPQLRGDARARRVRWSLDVDPQDLY